MSRRISPELELLLAVIDDAFNKPAWHGPNLRAVVRGVPLRQALWRPRAKRHCIAEIAVHCAYWKYAARRRLLGEKRGSFPLKGSNWFPLPPRMDEAMWKGYVKLLDDMHEQFRGAVADLSPKRLREVPKGAKATNAKLLYGMAAHDVYHTGQIRLLKAIQGG